MRPYSLLYFGPRGAANDSFSFIEPADFFLCRTRTRRPTARRHCPRGIASLTHSSPRRDCTGRMIFGTSTLLVFSAALSAAKGFAPITGRSHIRSTGCVQTDLCSCCQFRVGLRVLPPKKNANILNRILTSVVQPRNNDLNCSLFPSAYLVKPTTQTRGHLLAHAREGDFPAISLGSAACQQERKESWS